VSCRHATMHDDTTAGCNFLCESAVQPVHKQRCTQRPAAGLRGAATAEQPGDSTTCILIWFVGFAPCTMNRFRNEPNRHVTARSSPVSERPECPVIRLQVGPAPRRHHHVPSARLAAAPAQEEAEVGRRQTGRVQPSTASSNGSSRALRTQHITVQPLKLSGTISSKQAHTLLCRLCRS
jgi:hypothetical protein